MLCVCSDSVPGDEEEKGSGVTDFNRTDQKLGGGWHPNPRSNITHVPNHGSHIHLSGIFTSIEHLYHIFSLLWGLDTFKWSTNIMQHFTFQELSECHLVLFPHTLLMLSASPRMSGFIFQVHQLKLCFICKFLPKQYWIILQIDISCSFC